MVIIELIIGTLVSIIVQMEYLSNKIRELAAELIKPRAYNYSQDHLFNFLASNPAIHCQNSLVKNKRGELLDTILIRGPLRSDTCILYAHGLGSNKIEALPVVESFKDVGYDVCAFDFSGSGRSQGEYTTYGLREQDDVNAVLAWLDAGRSYGKYVLWGRSMGGASVVLSQARNMNKKVQCIVLDSPFCSFEKAALEIASKTTYVPQLMLNLLLQPIKQILRQQHNNVNPFSVDISEAVSRVECRIMLVYSKGDSIVDCSHSKQIGRMCKKDAVEIEIEQDHNRPRKRDTYDRIKAFIMQSIDMHESRARRSRSKSRGISVSSKQNQPINTRDRKSITSSINSIKSSNHSRLDRTQNLKSIGSYPSQISSPRGLKQPYIKSVVLAKNQPRLRDSIRHSLKYRNSLKYCSRIL